MKVLLINGSPKKQGNTAYALGIVADELNAEGIETHDLWVGTKPISGCISCQSCKETRECIFKDDAVNEAGELLAECDGLVIGAPTYYFNASGQMRSFLDRLFYHIDSSVVRGKPCACVSVARRAGTVTAIDELMHYPNISQMPIVSSCYPPMMFGSKSGEAAQDAEGIRIMQILGRNMAWMLKCFEAGRAAGIALPEEPERVFTNFIR